MATTQSASIVAAQTSSPGVFDILGQTKKFLETGIGDPFVAGFLVFGGNLVLFGIINTIHYSKKRKTGKKAISDTLKESGIIGGCVAVGAVAGNAVAATGLVLITPVALPLVTSIAVTFLIKKFWDKTVSGSPKTVRVAPSSRRRAVRSQRTTLHRTAAALS